VGRMSRLCVETSCQSSQMNSLGGGCAGCVHASNGWAGGNKAHPQI
jgi:hypothetical protein